MEREVGLGRRECSPPSVREVGAGGMKCLNLAFFFSKPSEFGFFPEQEASSYLIFYFICSSLFLFYCKPLSVFLGRALYKTND